MRSLRIARRLVQFQISEWVKAPAKDELSDEYFRACADVARFAKEGHVELVDVLSEFEGIVQVLLEHLAAEAREPLEGFWAECQDRLILAEMQTDGPGDPE